VEPDHGAARREEALCKGVDGREHGEVAGERTGHSGGKTVRLAKKNCASDGSEKTNSGILRPGAWAPLGGGSGRRGTAPRAVVGALSALGAGAGAGRGLGLGCGAGERARWAATRAVARGSAGAGMGRGRALAGQAASGELGWRSGGWSGPRHAWAREGGS
jgi:hypothetical protein